MSATRRRKIVWWILGGAAATLVVFAGLIFWFGRPAALKARVTAGLSQRLNLDVTIDTLSVTVFPRPRVSGTGLAMRVPNRPELPPFISVGRFWMDIGPLSLIRKHVDTVHADGLKIVVPPSGSREGLTSDATKDDGANGNSKIIIDRLIAHDAELHFLRRKPGRTPLVFQIHELTMRELGFDRVVPFETKLTNPIPHGRVDASGSVGPWPKGDVAEMPVAGDYTFTNADLSTIKSIGGTLSSTGRFDGSVTAIHVVGTTDTPDFNLDLGGEPVRLTSSFDAVVDGTDGTTRLQKVTAKMRDTTLVVTGAITNLEGPGRHSVDLDVDVRDGRIEDLIALAVTGREPPLTGDVTLRTTFSLPPGPTPVRERLALAGNFGLSRATFNRGEIQKKLEELSRRSQGKDKGESPGRVMTNLRGRFAVKRGTLHLPALSFHVPGATVNLAGTYRFDTTALDFRGTLRMQARVSEAVGGFKSIFLIPFDALFRKEGAGAVIPIKISGTAAEPRFGMEVGKVFRRTAGSR